MKILRLDLRAYGPFTGVALDFPAEGPGLHLVHGPNEAGKSSALRALERLFFGFPHRIDDHFLHESKRQRVGATVRAADGSELAFLRRRGKARTLRGPDDEAAVDDARLAALLAGVGGDRFHNLYLTDLAALAQGGREIIEGDGDFGPILFSGSGLAGMPKVLRELRAEAEGLFSPMATATRPTINAAVIALQKEQRDRDVANLSGEAWRGLREDHADALRRRDAVKADHDRLESEAHRLARLSDAMAVLPRWRAGRRAYDALGPVVILPEGFAADLDAARAALGHQAAAADACRRALAAIDAGLARFDDPDRLLAEAGAIDALRERLGSYREARDVRPALARDLDRAETIALAGLREIDPGRTLDAADSLATTAAQKGEARELGRALGKLEADEEATRAAVADLEGEGVPPAPAEGPGFDRAARDLAALIVRSKSKGDLDEAVDAATAKLRRLEAQAEAELARLRLWGGTLDGLAAAPMPGAETVARFEEEIGDARRAVRLVDDEATGLADGLAEADRAIERARLAGDPPTEADLNAARGDRDRAWAAVRDAWLAGAPPGDGDARGASADYERRVEAADRAADLLRREADRVAELAALRADRGRLADRAAAIPPRRAEAVARREAAEARWRETWRAVGVDPLPPAEMRGWLADHARLLVKAEAVAAERAEADRARRRRDDAVGEIRDVLVGLGEPAPAPAGSLAAWVARAESLIARAEHARRLAEARARARTAADRLGAWRGRWARAVRPLGLPPDATPTEAEAAIGKVDGLLDRVREARRFAADLARADAEIERFERDAREVAGRAGVDSASRPPEAILHDLTASAETVRLARQARAAEEARLASAVAEVQIQSARIDELRRRAGCDTADDLPAAVEASREARSLLAAIRDDEGRLLGLAAGGSIADLERAFAAVGDPDALATRLRDLDGEIRASRDRLESLNVEVGGLRARLDAMDGSSKAADADGRARRWRAEIEAHVEHYARVRLAEAVLRRAIDAYRERNQGPILARTSALFAALTVGSFAGVKLEVVDESDTPLDRPALKGLRTGPGRETVPLSGMSEGTADALFLAVRLATLEHYLDASEPMPFIVDDILVHFDDARASAALRALAALSSRTQILFFTHHEHLIELARSALPPESWTLQRLPAAGPG